MYCKYCVEYNDHVEKTGTFTVGCHNFKLGSLEAHNASSSHVPKDRKWKVARMTIGTSKAEKCVQSLNQTDVDLEELHNLLEAFSNE